METKWVKTSNGRLMKIRAYDDGDCFIYEPSVFPKEPVAKTSSFADALATVELITGGKVTKIE